MTVEGLRCLRCCKAYGKAKALDEVSLDVAVGEVVGLVGPNGAGKTTLLHAVTGLTQLDSGTITVNGIPIRERKAKARLSFMPDDLPRPRQLTARELVELVCRLYSIPPDNEQIEDLAEQFELSGRLDEPMAGFSHGMGRKVDLLSALVVDPQVLVMDEPFSGMDPITVDVLTDLIKGRGARGRSTLLSTHDLELAALLSDRVVMLTQGRVAFSGTPAQILATHGTADIRDAFRTITEMV